MSVERCWEYRVRAADLACDQFEAMDRVVFAVESVIPPCHWAVGSAGRDRPHVQYVMQRANRTKARRLAALLDEHLGVRGDLTELDFAKA